MELDKIKKMRDQLEDTMLTIVTDFEKQTNIQIDNIGIDRWMGSDVMLSSHRGRPKVTADMKGLARKIPITLISESDA